VAGMNFWAILAGTAAFFAVGAVWYGWLFGKAWQREAGIAIPPRGIVAARIMALTFVLELLIVMTLGHTIGRLAPPPHVIMMIAVGFGLSVMAPAIGINYLHQRRSLKLFLIDAGHVIAGMAAVGAVFVALV